MKAFIRNYTKEEIKSIKDNLFKAFGQEYLSVYTRIRDLQKYRDKFYIRPREVYYYYVALNGNEYGKEKGWYQIYITYKRAGVIFFKFKNDMGIEPKEYWFVEQSAFTASLVPSVIKLNEYCIPDHNLDLIKFEKDVPFDITIVKNDCETFIV